MFLPCESKRKEHRMTQKKTPDPGPDLDLNLSDFALFLAVTVKDPRIVELDAVVSEVKQSEEWEEAKMSILSVGIERGRAEGRARGQIEGRARGRIEGRAAGNLEGKRESILALLGQLGPVPEELKAEIMAQADTRTLTRWLIAAAGSDSVEEFENRITRDK